MHEEQVRAGHIPMLMPTLQSADLWRESGRFDDYGQEMLRIQDRHGRDMLYGPTNEELITDIFRSHVGSYKDLPMTLYHIQWKFRDEIRPRFGVMRGREFLMKDGYSFDIDEASARTSYYKMFIAYLRSFRRMGLKAMPVAADTGPIGGELSHEFIILAETGESEIFCHSDILDLPVPEADYDGDLAPIMEIFTQYYARSDEMHDGAMFGEQVPADKQLTARGIEVGHIFKLGTKYSEKFGAVYTDDQKQSHPMIMGCYGIGVTRIVAAAIEQNHDDKGIIWPASIAPYEVVLIPINAHKSEAVQTTADALYTQLSAAGIEVLLDDRDQLRPGAKFADAELLGFPHRIVIGDRALADGAVEYTDRTTGAAEAWPIEAVVQRLLDILKST